MKASSIITALMPVFMLAGCAHEPRNLYTCRDAAGRIAGVHMRSGAERSSLTIFDTRQELAGRVVEYKEASAADAGTLIRQARNYCNSSDSLDQRLNPSPR